jgi:hypothetical protein
MTQDVTKPILAIEHYLILEEEGNEEKNECIHMPCSMHFDDRRSILTYKCLVDESHSFGIEFRKHYDQTGSTLSLAMMHFDDQLVTASEAEDLGRCSYSNRPDWVADHQRQILDTNDYMDIVISTIGLPLNIYLTATHVPIYGLMISRFEKNVDFCFTCGSKETTFFDIIPISLYCSYK